MLKDDATKQEIFDYIVKALFAQGEPSVSSYDFGLICVYRSASGLKCAVGHIITDDQYSPEMDNGDGISASRLCKIVSIPLIDRNPDFMDDIQAVHDNWEKGNDIEFVDRLRQFADRHSLRHDVINTTPINGVMWTNGEQS